MAGEEIENVRSINDKSESSMPSITIEPLFPSALTPKSILVESIPDVTSTPDVDSKLSFPNPAGKVSVLITILSIAASKFVMVTLPSIATGTPFKNFTEYSKISPADELATLPLDKSILDEPASAASSAVLITTEDESETPFRVIEPVASLSEPRVTIVSPLMSEATSTFDEPPEVNVEGAPVPLKTSTSLLASKSEIITLPSCAEVTDPLAANVTSYKYVSASAVAVYRPALALIPAVEEPLPPELEPPPLSGVGLTGAGAPPPPPPPQAARIIGNVIALKYPNLLREIFTKFLSSKIRSSSLTFLGDSKFCPFIICSPCSSFFCKSRIYIAL